MTTAEPAGAAQAPDPVDDALAPAAHGVAGHIETRGIDHIPDDERHGHPRELFFVWAGASINYLPIVLGGSLVLLGLNTRQGLAIVLLGNLFWAFNGILAVSGPASGTPSSILTRATYGIRGNRVATLIANWSVCVAYAAINLAMGSLAGHALLDHAGIPVDTATEAAIVGVLALATLLISVYGHATIVRLGPLFTGVLTAVLVMLAVFVVIHARPGHRPADAPHGSDLLVAALMGFAIIASGPLSWGTGADYARYLPAHTSRRAVAAWTTLGGFLPSVALGAVGVLAGTAVDMTDPQVSLKDIVPGWFYPLFLLAIVVGSVANNILTTYSSALALQATGIRVGQWTAVLLDGIAATAITAYALFVTDFLDALDNILELTVVILGPGLAISVADLILRRNHYPGPGLHDETPTSAYWYHRGVNGAGLAAQTLGSAAALLCLNSTMFQGPITELLGGADISAFVGPLVGAGVYTALFRALYPDHLARARHEKRHDAGPAHHTRTARR
ncbi:hypothetical protein B4N89_36965 [Embleya scabrispora]|uniref:Nitrate reductase n=1 Tax=Embleya scabrispora TaxID=159449 RepID=A0A1T3NMB6_9ACTN|nr:cytosine permease [Embleya scabrispora]OPC77858.1 hypothetical protein B4N89_36965 [Embleya scabrispora]